MVVTWAMGLATALAQMPGGPKGLTFSYPLTISPLDLSGTNIQYTPLPDGSGLLSIIGRTALWWTILDKDGMPSRHVELQADAALIELAQMPTGKQPVLNAAMGLDSQQVRSIYMEGDVRLIEQHRSITCQQLYYDLDAKKALAVDATLQDYDPQRDVPIYLRAARLRQEALDRFRAEDVVFTTSEFYTPQWSLSADRVTVEDVRSSGPVLPGRGGGLVIQMEDVELRYYDKRLIRLAKVRSDLARTDLPIRSVRLGYDQIWGASVETRWQLPSVLGLDAPEWVDAVLLADYYGNRGPGIGADIDYDQQRQFGRVLGYVIYDTGTDTLGKTPERRDIEPPFPTRGRFTAQHRQFLPGRWQLTGEVSYLSDRNFLEQYHRHEFYCEKEQETLLHLKRIEANRGVSVLVKGRVNDFADTVTELPSGQFHWTGQSLFNDRLVYQTDTYIGRFAYRPDHEGPPPPIGGQFMFASTYHRLDMPLRLANLNLVPFAGALVGYDDGMGFGTDLEGRPIMSTDLASTGQAGLILGLPTWHRVYPGIQSRLLDLNQLRHLISGQVMAVLYEGSRTAQQRDLLMLGLNQRFQTRRGTGARSHTVDLLYWDTELVLVDHDADGAGPYRLLWSDPAIGLWQRRTNTLYGACKDYISTELAWHITDSTDLLADAYIDAADLRLDQLNIGISRVRWPDLRYYIGTRYLGAIAGAQASHVLTAAAWYTIDPRYSLVVSSQYELEQDKGLRNALTLIRRYHRLNYGLTISTDRSLDQFSVVLGLWPQGVPEVGMGLGRHAGFGL